MSVLGLLLVCWSALAAGNDNAEVLGLLEQNESQLQVHSCGLELFGDGKLNFSAAYRRDGDRERCQVQIHAEPKYMIDWLRLGNTVYQLHPDQTPPQWLIRADRRAVKFGNPAAYRLLWMAESISENRALTELLLRHPVSGLKREASGDVSFSLTNFHRTKWTLASAANFAPKSMEVRYAGGGRSWQEVKEFAEPKPGVFFPKLIVGTQQYDGRPESKFEIHFSDITVDQEHPPGTFTQVVAEGTHISDEINQVVDVMGPGGQRVRTNRQMVSPDGLGMAQLRGQTTEVKAGIPWLWLALGFSALLLFAFWLRRRRSAATD